MPLLTLTRACIFATTLVCVRVAVAQGVPPTAPTAPVAAPAAMQPGSLSQQRAPAPSQRAQVTFEAGQLSVFADNSSLNQILRDIARVTGMKITGGVVDERVYGSYGPADTSTVLTALLRGTGSNMLLIFDAMQAPEELVLTPRGGGATPPNPNASRERDEEDLPPQRINHYRRPGAEAIPPRPGVMQGAPVPQQPSLAPAAAPAPGEQDAPSVAPAAQPEVPAASSDTTTQESPNGVKTPQQIYEQLMKMQQQQQKTPQTTTPQP